MWFETLRTRACIVRFYHTRANIYTNELGNIRCERTQDLASKTFTSPWAQNGTNISRFARILQDDIHFHRCL